MANNDIIYFLSAQHPPIQLNGTPISDFYQGLEIIAEEVTQRKKFICAKCGINILYQHYERCCDFKYCPNCGVKIGEK